MSAQTQPAPRPRVLVADDHGVVVEGVRGLLAKDYDVVGIVMDGRALIAEASRVRPDVIVLDVAMPLLNGLDAGRKNTGDSSQGKACVPDDADRSQPGCGCSSIGAGRFRAEAFRRFRTIDRHRGRIARKGFCCGVLKLKIGTCRNHGQNSSRRN